MLTLCGVNVSCSGKRLVQRSAVRALRVCGERGGVFLSIPIGICTCSPQITTRQQPDDNHAHKAPAQRCHEEHCCISKARPQPREHDNTSVTDPKQHQPQESIHLTRFDQQRHARKILQHHSLPIQSQSSTGSATLNSLRTRCCRHLPPGPWQAWTPHSPAQTRHASTPSHRSSRTPPDSQTDTHTRTHTRPCIRKPPQHLLLRQRMPPHLHHKRTHLRLYHTPVRLQHTPTRL